MGTGSGSLHTIVLGRQGVSKKLYNDIENVTVWQVLQ
jgi:hypothetical protein